MTDQHLRELERAAAQGDLEAEGRLLAERLRAGRLAPRDLSLARSLGDPAALRVEGAEPAEPPPLAALLEALGAREPAWLVRALTAGVRRLLPVYRTWLPAERRCEAAVEAAEAWLAAPGAALAQQAWEAALAAQGAVNETTYAMLERWEIGMISSAQRTALEYVARTAHDAADGAFRVETGEGHPVVSSLLRLEEAARQGGWLGGDGLRAALRDALLPLVLA